MAFLADELKLTQEDSIMSIIDTEIGILQNMAKLSNENFTPELLGTLDPCVSYRHPDLCKLVIAFQKIMCGFSSVDEGLAANINSITKLLAVKKGINPCNLECCIKEHKCGCKNK